MSFKEELRIKKLSSPFIFGEKINFNLNRVDIHYSCDLYDKVLNQNGNLRIHMNKTLGICEVRLLI